MKQTIPMHVDEQRLIQRAKDDPQVFAQVYRLYFDRVYSYVRYQVADDASADDVTAQVFERCLLGFKKYNPKKGSFPGWLFGIARNALREYQRQRIQIPLDELPEPVDPQHLPEELISRWEETEILLKAVARLPEREREIIGLKFGAGLTNREIAGLLELSESNVGTVLYRALKKLRDILQGVAL